MIIANKHSHPDKTVFAASTQLLKRLRKSRTQKYDELRSHLTKNDKDAGSLFLPAVNLLFMLGLLEYRKKNDTFEYVGR